MNLRLSIRPAERRDLDELDRLWRQARAAAGLAVAAAQGREARTRHLLEDGCVLLGRLGGQPVARCTLELGQARIVDACVAPPWQRHGLGRRMVAAAERLAVRFGLMALEVKVDGFSQPFFAACGYRRAGRQELLRRSFRRRQTRFGRRIGQLLEKSGIPADYGQRHRLRLQEESRELASIGADIHGREQMLRPDAARAWRAMQQSAARESVMLQVASAYRSVGYQASIIERKKQRGQSIAEILRASAAPGFSEHHTGRAVDVATPGFESLEESFENTQAFEWLTTSADRFGFRLSYPRNNRHGILYEPWHWYFRG